MSRLTVYHYAKCGTCRKAVRFLRELGHEPELRDVVEQPPDERELAELISRSGLPAQSFFNTSGEWYKKLNLKEKTRHMDEREKIRLLASNGRLIRRPIVTDGRKVTVGFREETFRDVWGG